MKSLLAKIAIYKAVGLHLGEHEVAVSKVASTPLGTIEIASAHEPYTAENLSEVLERLLAPLLGRKRRIPVAVGLSASRLYFGTRPVSAGSTATPDAILQKALCVSNVCIDDLTADLLRCNVNKTAVASVAACRKKYMTSLVATLNRLGVRPFRAEPSPCALVRLADQQHRAPRRANNVLRVFLGPTQGLVVVVAGGLPLAWRAFVLPEGDEGRAILSAARTLRTQGRHYGIESSPDFALIHGRPDLQKRLEEEAFPSEVQTRVLWHEGPALDGDAMAFGLAQGCLAQNIKAFDLSRSLKARASLWEIFPWGELAFVTVLVACMGLLLGAHTMKLDEAYAVVRAQSSLHPCLSSADANSLESQTKFLEQKVEAVRKFIDTRILWSAYTRDIAMRLPATAQLSMFQGLNELACGKNARAGMQKKLFQLRATVPLPADGATPREIDTFLRALRNHPLLKRDFASVELADIKRTQATNTEPPTAAFNIICLPKGKGAPAPSDAGEGKKEAK